MAKIFNGFFKKLKMGWKKIWRRHKLKIIIFLLIFTFLVALLWRNIFISIYPGQAGVLWKRIGGTELKEVYGEGLHVIFPWDRMYIYALRNQQKTVSMKILTKGGLYIDVEFSVRFRPDRPPGFIYKEEEIEKKPSDNTPDKNEKNSDGTTKPIEKKDEGAKPPEVFEKNDEGSAPPSEHEILGLPLLHKRWGPDYVNTFILPEAKATMISVIGNVDRQTLQSPSSDQVQTKAFVHLSKELKDSKVYLHDLLIIRLSIPKSLSDAIERKLTQEQLLQEYKYRVEVAEMEKERKAIEAEGIKLFEQISGIPILKWRGLDVTSEIARSKNAKVIVIGTGAEGLPVILNAEK
jgi:regulator of protease activity HflC (stomatin/prohibitin superfamily)